jgi:hypothetical protein
LMTIFTVAFQALDATPHIRSLTCFRGLLYARRKGLLELRHRSCVGKDRRRATPGTTTGFKFLCTNSEMSKGLLQGLKSCFIF